MTDFMDLPYNETCAECDGWDLRLDNIEYREDISRWDFRVTCRECGAEWLDMIEDD